MNEFIRQFCEEPEFFYQVVGGMLLLIVGLRLIRR